MLAVGFVILMVSEFSGLAALRIVAVGVLLAGALGGGVRAGLALEPPALLQKIAARFTHRLARVLVVLLLLPVVLSLVLTLMGAVLRPHADQVSAAALNAASKVAANSGCAAVWVSSSARLKVIAPLICFAR